jgi:S1-C subfamily serine protease
LPKANQNLKARSTLRTAAEDAETAHDLAIIQIKAPVDLIPMTLGDSRNLQVGQKVYAIGNPFGLSGTMT